MALTTDMTLTWLLKRYRPDPADPKWNVPTLGRPPLARGVVACPLTAMAFAWLAAVVLTRYRGD